MVALYASIDGVVTMSDVDSMMIHAYRNESTMMITMMYDNVDDTIHV